MMVFVRSATELDDEVEGTIDACVVALGLPPMPISPNDNEATV